ncbi:MAG: prepilin-type N-terminal cleavage/methylation domain-containing protein [Candidatus Omnitrophica bacterium]|nr:prepilin-type N-terminal cleavage/methylation domain-containing protein [Candidatus Omnitrophota bacterium]
MNHHKKTFTLIEMLISISLVVILGLVVYSVLSSGIRVWHRANVSYIGEDVNIFFEKFSADLRNSFKYKGIDFSGSEHSLKFASLVKTTSKNYGLNRGPGEVSYFYSKDNSALFKGKKNLSDIFKNKQGFIQEVMPGVINCEFKYYSMMEKAWLSQWDEENASPKAVAVKIQVEYEGVKQEFTKTVIIPSS